MKTNEEPLKNTWTKTAKEIAEEIVFGWRVSLGTSIVTLITKVIQAERDSAAVLVEALEFYGKGHDHNHEMYQKIDCDKIPALKVVNLQKEFSLGISAKQICDEAVQPSFELLSGKIARQALAKHKKGTE